MLKLIGLRENRLQASVLDLNIFTYIIYPASCIIKEFIVCFICDCILQNYFLQSHAI